MIGAHTATGQVEMALDHLREGRPVVVVGHRHGSSLGVLVAAADRLSLTTMVFLFEHARGPLYALLGAQRLRELNLVPVSGRAGQEPSGAYFLPVDWSGCTTSGLSASDRLETVWRLAAPDSVPTDFVSHGQVTAIGARAGGVLERAGHTEAAVDLLHLAMSTPAAAACAILTRDGELASPAQLDALATEHGLLTVSIGDIISYRRAHEQVLERSEEVSVPLECGTFRAVGYHDQYEPGEHLALLIGDIGTCEPVAVHVHAECLTGDVLGSGVCGCQVELWRAMRYLAELGCGVLVYLRAVKGDTARFVHRPFSVHAEATTMDGRDAAELNDARDGVLRSILADLGISEDRVRPLDAMS